MDRRMFLKRAFTSALASTMAGTLRLDDAGMAANSSTKVELNNTDMTHKCKITILKRECYKDLQNKYLADPIQAHAHISVKDRSSW